MATWRDEDVGVGALRASLARHEQISRSATGILAGFEKRVSRVEESMAPIEALTRSLTKAQANIDIVIEEFEGIHKNLSTAQEVRACCVCAWSGRPAGALLPAPRIPPAP